MIFAYVTVGIIGLAVLGFLAGAAVAFSIQSSSATIGILQALSITGKLTFGSIYSVIIGIYLGDCVTTAIVCSIGAKADPKRVGLVSDRDVADFYAASKVICRGIEPWK